MQSREAYKKLRNKKTEVNHENPNGNATLCDKCGVCEQKCPQKIYIRQELEKVKQELGRRNSLF